jgi:D-aminopeptidase
VISAGARRARDIGIQIGHGTPGPNNGITDVPGVRVGHTTLIHGEGRLVVGEGPVRTGVTVILPNDDVWRRPVFAGCHVLNGNGELTGMLWIGESGMLTTPIGLTNTGSVGVVHEALSSLEARSRVSESGWYLPVVGETWDGTLNDLFGSHVRPEHVEKALITASGGPVTEGNVGGGTGMISHGFKGGIGTASRSVSFGTAEYILGVLVQANHGRRERLTIDGVPVGEYLSVSEIPLPSTYPNRPPGSGSIITIVATDAPLLPHQCRRLAQRAELGVARTGGTGEHWSGDLFLAFSTGNAGVMPSEREEVDPLVRTIAMLTEGAIDALIDAVVETTEEAITNALVAAETMEGRDGAVAHAIPHDRLRALMLQYRDARAKMERG